ncbi:MAG: exodeoxyribonuclease VII small subunit [Ornithinimicrobium sp.]
MSQDPVPTSVADLSYEQARDELIAIVARIESGKVPLEESMALWERGEELAAHCQSKLDSAQERLDAASDQASDNAVSADAKVSPEASG